MTVGSGLLKVAEEKSDNRANRVRVKLAGLEASCSAFTEKKEKSSVFHSSPECSFWLCPIQLSHWLHFEKSEANQGHIFGSVIM